MKVEELRIGNLVEVFNESPTQVLAISDKNIALKFDSTKHMVAELHQIEPIPLTEEWLVKLGFEEGKANDGLTEYSKSIRLVISLSKNIYYSHKNIPIYHVHQLQNLYFALTREELTIKK